MRALFLCALLTGAAVQQTEAAEPVYPRVDVVVRLEVSIAAEPKLIWPYLNRLDLWLEGVVAQEHVSGPAGAKGEVIRLIRAKPMEGLTILSRTVEQVEHSWLVTRLEPEPGTKPDVGIGNFVSYNSFRLEPGDSLTRVIFEKYQYIDDRTLAGADQEQIQRKELEWHRIHQVWLQAGLERMKQLVERGYRGAGSE